MKKKTIIICIALIVLIPLITMMGLWRFAIGYSSVLKTNWGISLPVKSLYSEIYEKDSGSSFHGDGIRYHVFSYKYEDYIELMFAWSPVERETLYYDSASEAATAWLDEIDVPEEDRPNYSACATWHRSKEDNSEILFFWDAQLNRLYIVENLI